MKPMIAVLNQLFITIYSRMDMALQTVCSPVSSDSAPSSPRPPAHNAASGTLSSLRPSVLHVVGAASVINAFVVERASTLLGESTLNTDANFFGCLCHLLHRQLRAAQNLVVASRWGPGGGAASPRLHPPKSSQPAVDHTADLVVALHPVEQSALKVFHWLVRHRLDILFELLVYTPVKGTYMLSCTPFWKCVTLHFVYCVCLCICV